MPRPAPLVLGMCGCVSAAASEAVACGRGSPLGAADIEDWNSLQAKIPQEFWDELLHEKLIDPHARVPKQPDQ
jgi:D-threo-aldose 1-dehydrogenase